MGEVLVQQFSVEEENEVHSAVEDESSVEQSSFPKLDGVLFPIVEANADVIAPCSWMGGAEVSLSTALLNYPETMTEENADDVIANVHDFLAGQIGIEEDVELKIEEEYIKEPEPEHSKPLEKINKSNSHSPKQPTKTSSPPKEVKVGVVTEFKPTEHEVANTEKARSESPKPSVVIGEDLPESVVLVPEESARDQTAPIIESVDASEQIEPVQELKPSPESYTAKAVNNIDTKPVSMVEGESIVIDRKAKNTKMQSNSVVQKAPEPSAVLAESTSASSLDSRDIDRHIVEYEDYVDTETMPPPASNLEEDQIPDSENNVFTLDITDQMTEIKDELDEDATKNEVDTVYDLVDVDTYMETDEPTEILEQFSDNVLEVDNLGEPPVSILEQEVGVNLEQDEVNGVYEVAIAIKGEELFEEVELSEPEADTDEQFDYGNFYSMILGDFVLAAQADQDYEEESTPYMLEQQIEDEDEPSDDDSVFYRGTKAVTSAVKKTFVKIIAMGRSALRAYSQ